jgi:hypothetical protein
LEQQEKSLTIEELEQQRITHSIRLLRDGFSSYDSEYQKALLEHVYNLETSHISEVLTGETRTQFEFDSRNGQLYALQPEGITDWQKLHENGVLRARLKASRSSRFNFYAQIAEAELEEAKAQEEMVQAGEPATLFSVSLCGDDVASAEDLRLIGRDPELKRGYVRASVFDGEKMHLYSYSRDGMGLQDAREIYDKILDSDLQEDANSIDILRKRILKKGIHNDLLDDIAPLKGTDTYKFVLAQTDLLDTHISGLSDLSLSNLPSSIIAEHTNNLRYDIMSSFKRRLEGQWIDLGSMGESVAYAGLAERSAGTQFAGCDVIITSNQNNSLAEAGYLNTGDISRRSWQWQDGFCQVKECPTQKPKRQKVKVGPCSVCKNCQALFDNNRDPSKEYKRLHKKQVRTSFWLW